MTSRRGWYLGLGYLSDSPKSQRNVDLRFSAEELVSIVDGVKVGK